MAGAIPTVYRGGPSLMPTLRDVKVNPQTGLVLPIRGVSVHADPAKVQRFGGAYRIESIPAGLKIEQRGKDPDHYEIIPARAMSMQEYERLLAQVVLKRTDQNGAEAAHAYDCGCPPGDLPGRV